MIWQQYVTIQKADWMLDMLGQLTANQRTVLAGLAKSSEKEPQGKEFVNRLGIASSSIQRTIMTLVKKDLLYKDSAGYYQVLSPVVKTDLANNKYLILSIFSQFSIIASIFLAKQTSIQRPNIHHRSRHEATVASSLNHKEQLFR